VSLPQRRQGLDFTSAASRDAAEVKSWPTAIARAAFAALAVVGSVLAAGGCSSGYDIPLPAAQACASDAECPSANLCNPSTLTCAPQGDVDCQLNNEPSQGDACSADCTTATCASERGKRICTCSGGVFVQCACLPPDNWPYEDVPTAPYCDRLTGEPRYMNADRCTTGETCLSSTAPGQSCVCIENGWQCGLAELQGVPAGAPECESLGSGQQAVLKNKPCTTEWQLCIARDYNPDGTAPRGCGCFDKNGSLEWYCGATNRWWRAE